MLLTTALAGDKRNDAASTRVARPLTPARAFGSTLPLKPMIPRAGSPRKGDLLNPIEIEITPSLKDLVNHVKKGECILFLGAGIHASPSEGSPYSYPEEQSLPWGVIWPAKWRWNAASTKSSPESPLVIFRGFLFVSKRP